MPKIKLTILASDMKTTNYLDPLRCPITMALHRAGFPNWKDVGYGANDNGNNNRIPFNKNYREMTNKVLGMMRYEQPNSGINSFPTGPATDFDWELEYPDEE